MDTPNPATTASSIPVPPTPIPMVITPDIAEQMLTRLSPKQRGLSSTVVDGYVRDMVAGAFKPYTGDPIRFDTSGDLIDGQHRLRACVKAGTPLYTFVMTGCDPEIYDVLDMGRKRAASDALRGDGLESPKELASITSAVLFITGGRNTSRGVIEYTRTNAESLTRLLPLYREFLIKQRHHAWRTSARTICAGLFMLSKQGAESLEAVLEFGTTILADDLPPHNPCRTLREGLISGWKGTTSEQVRATYQKMAHAWNAHRTGAELKILKVMLTANKCPAIPKSVLA